MAIALYCCFMVFKTSANAGFFLLPLLLVLPPLSSRAGRRNLEKRNNETLNSTSPYGDDYDAEISVQIGAAHLSIWLFPFVPILFFIDNAAEATEVEETAVKASINCGPWPVYQVTSLASCEYPVLNKSMLGAIKKGRNRLLNSCLFCADGTCSAKNRDDLDSHSLFTCKMLFRAPLSIGLFAGASASAATVMRSTKQDPYAQPFSATITYTISADGRVTDLHVADIDSALERSEVEQIIKAGAQSVRFLPLDIGGVTHPIAQIQSLFVLP